jgi:hypothetical protein
VVTLVVLEGLLSVDTRRPAPHQKVQLIQRVPQFGPEQHDECNAGAERRRVQEPGGHPKLERARDDRGGLEPQDPERQT